MDPNSSRGQSCSTSTFRSPTSDERKLLARLLSVDFQGRSAIIDQLRDAQVRTIDEFGSLEILSTSGPHSEVKQSVPVEATGADSDGVEVYALLHVHNGRVQELERYKADGSPIKVWPPADELEIYSA